jgi:hypothetical protein
MGRLRSLQWHLCLKIIPYLVSACEFGTVSAPTAPSMASARTARRPPEMGVWLVLRWRLRDWLLLQQGRVAAWLLTALRTRRVRRSNSSVYERAALAEAAPHWRLSLQLCCQLQSVPHLLALQAVPARLQRCRGQVEDKAMWPYRRPSCGLSAASAWLALLCRHLLQLLLLLQPRRKDCEWVLVGQLVAPLREGVVNLRRCRRRPPAGRTRSRERP